VWWISVLFQVTMIAEPQNPAFAGNPSRIISEQSSNREVFVFDEQIQAAMDSAPVPIYVKDLERRYLMANRVTHELAGVEPGELIGRTDAEVLPPEAETLIRESDMRVLRDEEPCEREEAFPAGTQERIFLTVKFPYLDADGRLAGITGVSTEITALRAAERLQHDLAATRERTIEELQFSRLEAIERLAQAVEMHDGGVSLHVNQTARISAYLGSQLGLDDEQIQLLRAAAPMHRVEHRILAGAESELLQMAARIALTRQEWFDGRGSPRGIAGEEIPIEARIVAVAEAFDTLLDEEPGREAKGAGEAIRQESGTRFDPEVVEVLLEHLDDAVGVRG
jgi:PAS domain S-box-containing protein